MYNLSSYCGLVDAKIKASDNDLPVKATAASYCYNRRRIVLDGYRI